jgi:hypothetical protein
MAIFAHPLQPIREHARDRRWLHDATKATYKRCASENEKRRTVKCGAGEVVEVVAA